MNNIFAFYNYYQSFFNVFIRRKQIETERDLWFWSFYIFFKLWYEPKDGNNPNGSWGANYAFYNRDVFSRETSNVFKIWSLLFYCFGQFIIILFLILYPYLCIYLALFVDENYWYWLEYPRANRYGKQYPKESKSLSHWPVSFSSMLYHYNINKHTYFTGNKHYFNTFCEENGISETIKCFKSTDEILDYIETCEAKEFVVKQSSCWSSKGYDVQITTKPQKFIKDIPNVVVQPRLKNHSSIIQITNNPNTLCSFRLMTYCKELHQMGNKTECFFKCQTNRNALVDNISSDGNVSIYLVDIQNEEICMDFESEELIPHMQIYIPSNINCRQKVIGLNSFAMYCEKLHWKYFSKCAGIGWDITKTEDSTWTIIEINTKISYYPSNIQYCNNLLQWFIKDAGYENL